MTILAVNPGRVSGLAILSVAAQPRLVGYAAVEVADNSNLIANIAAMITDSTTVESGVITIRRACIEDQYMMKGERLNPRSLIQLARIAGRWHTCALIYAEDGVEYVHPQTWQMGELGIPRTAPRKTRKDLAMMIAGRHYGVKLKRHEAADAIMLGRWYAIETFYREIRA